jgi:hypothetical protein
MALKVRSRIARALLEALSTKKVELGQVGFKDTSISDPHIQDIINAAASAMGVNPADVAKKMQGVLDKIEEMKKYSYLLYDTAARNAAETAAFDLMDQVDHPTAEKFDPVTFLKLIEMIQLEHSQFFPLRAPGETNYIFSISPILLPSNKSKYKPYNELITTAAATEKGEFFFNVPFMQKLMNFATFENLKPKGKKYESNGGPIPDAYAYIEFLIMHELLHYTYGDFATGKRLPEFSHKIHNFAQDYRSNYQLVKSGYDQLPIGLFSDHINYDRQRKYKDMAQLVHDELNKLPKNLQQIFLDIADLDDHQQPPPPPPPPPPTPPRPPEPPRPLQAGDIVREKKTGEFFKVTNITADGKVETVPATDAEVAAAKTPMGESL